MTLLAVGSSVALARELVRYALTHWGYDRSLIDDSILVMSEITTNAVNAAPGHHIRIRIATYNGAPLLECWDPAPELPLPRDAGADAVSGRGLAIVAAYAQETGTRPSATAQGKIIWALMPPA
ncbi:ATP-binding protein [Actinomadura sp. NPDC048394]|uniref:ATP-binding protein n=1 Tax=Actinomadura sp. NPDC048394 TaxID=3158223 RepID=UPI0033C5E441